MIKLPNPNSQAAAERLKPLENVNPRVYHVKSDRELDDNERNEAVRDPFDNQEIFDLIRIINDPEHPYTLEQLHVVKLEDVKVTFKYDFSRILIVSPFYFRLMIAKITSQCFLHQRFLIVAWQQ